VADNLLEKEDLVSLENGYVDVRMIPNVRA
jgi:hypothetical protein